MILFNKINAAYYYYYYYYYYYSYSVKTLWAYVEDYLYVCTGEFFGGKI